MVAAAPDKPPQKDTRSDLGTTTGGGAREDDDERRESEGADDNGDDDAAAIAFSDKANSSSSRRAARGRTIIICQRADGAAGDEAQRASVLRNKIKSVAVLVAWWVGWFGTSNSQAPELELI